MSEETLSGPSGSSDAGNGADPSLPSLFGMSVSEETLSGPSGSSDASNEPPNSSEDTHPGHSGRSDAESELPPYDSESENEWGDSDS